MFWKFVIRGCFLIRNINDAVFAIERKFIINVLLEHWVGQ